MIGAVVSTVASIAVVGLVGVVVLLLIRDWHSAAGLRDMRQEDTRRLRREIERHDDR